jgi:hypothetical protein
MQEVLVDGGQFVLEDFVEVRNDFGVALHGVGSGSRLWDAAVAAQKSGSLRGPRAGIKRPGVEHFPGTGLAGPAAGGDTGAGLQLLERACAFLDGLLQALLGQTVADADVHGPTPLRGSILSESDCVMQMIRI